MTNLIIKPKPITKENFKKFGDMITTADIKPIEINDGYAKRYDGIANLNTKKDNGESTISIFSALKRSFPMKVDMMEKHPLGSQAFIPMKETTFLAFVAPEGDKPDLNKIEISTHHFKGNFPNYCSLQATYLSSKSSKQILNSSNKWKYLLKKTKLLANKTHIFKNSLMKKEKINHIKINIFPDGGISRFRIFGKKI